jgi:hypothetical protein
MKYPSLNQVLKADREKLREWYHKLLPAQCDEQRNVIALIYKRLITPPLSDSESARKT